MTASAQVDLPALTASSPLTAALRKARWRILPLLSICYLVAYMDRANISFAAATMTRDLRFTPATYGLGAGLFFLSYALFEIPSNALLLRFGARRWLSRIMLTWGLVSAAMVFVRTPTHFYTARLLLGCAEAGYFPGALYLLSQWFPRSVRAGAISFFYLSLPISTTVMGACAGALLGMNGRLGLAGWQWMFLLEALPAVLLAFVLWFGLPDTLASATWLSPAERHALAAQLISEQDLPEAGLAPPPSITATLCNPRVLALGLVYFFELGTYYALAFSLPTDLGEKTGLLPAQVGYLLALTGLAGAALMLLGATLSDRSRHPRPFLVGGFTLMALGVLVAGLNPHGWLGASALLFTLLSFYAFQGPMVAAMTTLLPGKASALAIAATNMFALVGGFLGPYWMGFMRQTTGNYARGTALLCIPCALAAALMLKLAAPRKRAVP